VLARNERTVEEQLVSLRFLTRGSPCFGAVLAFGRDPLRFVPGAYVQFLRIEGTELGDPIRSQRRLDGPLHQIVRHLDDLIDLNISVATDIAADRIEHAEPDYPAAALRQLTRNALIHRNYESSNAPTRIYWFADRVEVHSPGGLFGQVTAGSFGTGTTDYRNPLVAEVLATLGYVQRFGYGIPLARRALRDNGNPEPDFTFEASAVLATVRCAR
jgi:ATP-dependent DNA helicase RecG